MVLLVCCLTLTAYVQFIAFHLVSCRDCFYGYFGNHSVNSNAAMITSDVDMVVEGDNDDYYGNHEDIQEDMDWEPSTNVTFYTTNVDRESKMKSKCRIAHIVRRTSPLYWRHPLLAMEEYSYAASIRSPGRSFIQAGRAFPPIHEGVHFFSGLVSQVHVIPRDGPHEIARGRRFVTSDIDSHGWCSFLRAGRAWLYGFVTKLATTKLVGRRNGPDEITSEIDSEQGPPPLAMPDILTFDMMVPSFSESQPSSLSPVSETESPEQASLGAEADTVDDEDLQGFMFPVTDEDTEPQDDINKVEDLGVAALVVYELTEERTNACVEEEVPTGPVVLPLRRSVRVAERRQRLLLQNQGRRNTIHAEVSAPDALGSIIVNGRRRSARLLKTVKAVHSTNITCSKRSQRSRRSRCG
jgi:hypothetical protein